LMEAAIFQRDSTGVDFHISDTHGNTPVLAAAYGSCPLMTSSLLANGADVDDTNDRGWTPLHAVCKSPAKPIPFWLSTAQPDAVATLEIILRAGVSIAACDDRGHDAIYYAAVEGRHARVCILLGHGADAGPLPNGALPKTLQTAVKMAEVHAHRGRCEAFMMGLHPRLGQQSIVSPLDKEVARMVIACFSL
jgi:ankyrin repeat protein